MLDGLTILFGLERIKALPAWLFSDEALLQLGGFNAQQVRPGVCQRGAAKRQGERHPGPSCPDTLAKNMVKLHGRALEVVFNGAIGALAKAGVFGTNVTGIADGTDLETTKRYRGCGQGTRTVRSAETRGPVHAIDVTVYGWTVLSLIDAATKIPLAVQVGPIAEHETHWTRALVTQARTNLAGVARLHTVVCDQGCLEGSYGTVAHGRHHNRRDFQPNLSNAVVVRKWNGTDYGPGGNTVFLTNASVEQPWRPFDDDDARRLIENCGIKEAKPPWDLGHPPQNTERAGRVPVVFTRLMCALATAYRLPCERGDRGGEPVGWPRWRRQLLEQTRDHVIVLAQGSYGIFHLAEYSLL